MPVYCQRCVQPVPQAFPCFVCEKLYCFAHVWDHACVPDVPPLQHFIRPRPDPRHKLSLVQYHNPLRGFDPRAPDSTQVLGLLNASRSMSGWSAGHEEISGSHHIFPKSALVWVFEHMSDRQQKLILKLMKLPNNAGGMALTRLRSNLISPKHRDQTVRPEDRGDDPHHHRDLSLIGEEYLDLVRTESGHLEYRSLLYQQLAWFVSQIVAPRYFTALKYSGDKDTFTLTRSEATVITTLILAAEVIHYHVEDDPKLPSMSGNTFWIQEHTTFRKGTVRRRELAPLGTMITHYNKQRDIEREESTRRYQEVMAEVRFQDVLPRSGIYSYASKSERVTHFGKSRPPLSGSRPWLMKQLTTQLQVDIGACLDSLFHGDGKRWTEKSVKIVQMIARFFEESYQRFRDDAHSAWHKGNRESHLLLPSVAGTIDHRGVVTIWLHNSCSPSSDLYAQSKYVYCSSDWIRGSRV